MAALLEVSGLYKSFTISGSRALVQAVNGVSFAIQPGETLGLVGESGSGKTTVGRCILGLLDATDGSIRFRGQDITLGGRRSKSRGKMQLVFQEPAESLDPRQRMQHAIVLGDLALLVDNTPELPSARVGERPVDRGVRVGVLTTSDVKRVPIDR